LELLSVGIVRIEPTSPPETYLLSVTKSGDGNGQVTSSPTGIDCGSSCDASFENGIDVTLTASPDPGSIFSGWDGACSGTDMTCVVTMTQPREVIAIFSSISESNDWIVTGPMNFSRNSHTSTLLPNGKVLISGGVYDSEYLISSELYDPLLDTWTLTGSLNIPRSQHKAILLSDGKVLIVGGYNGSYLDSAEIYDPETGNWTITDSMNHARTISNAIMLNDGRILVAGGYNGNFLDSSEIYDPATGLWFDTGSLNEIRQSPTILLQNGKVLIAGGGNGSYSWIKSAEIFNPDTEEWIYTGSMTKFHDYSPLIQLFNGKILFPGAPSDSSCELYDPDSGTWSITGSMNIVRRAASYELLPNGKVLAAGGNVYGSVPGTTNSVELYDPTTGIWTSILPMNLAREWKPATKLINGSILISGETNSELYDSRPEVAVEQALGQSDPTDTASINFTVIFSEPILESSFDEADVTLGGTAVASTVVITEISPYDSTAFNISVSGMRSGGTVTAVIPAGVVEDLLGNLNLASTSGDNEVTLNGYTLNVTKSPMEVGLVMRSPDLMLYIYGTEVILTPIPSSGFLFSEWTGADAVDLNSNENETWSIIMDSNKDLIANFVPKTNLYSIYLPLILQKP
jgi:N-acetylneuraminic acid mutarotase